MPKNEAEDLSDTIYKINSKRNTDRSRRAKIIKAIDENIEVNLHVLVLGSGFLEMLSTQARWIWCVRVSPHALTSPD